MVVPTPINFLLSFFPLIIDEELGSWFAATYLLSGILMTPIGGYIGGLFGRRKVILLTHPGALIGWIITATSENIPMLFFGRMLTAISLYLHISSVGKFYYTYYQAHKKIPKYKLNFCLYTCFNFFIFQEFT